MAKPNCTIRCLKKTLFALHFVFAITGVFLIAYGAVRIVSPDRTWSRANETTLGNFEAAREPVDITRYGAMCFLLVGVIVLHIGGIGCYFSLKDDNINFLFRYSLFLVGTLCVQVILLILASGLHKLVVNNLQQSMSNSMTHIYGLQNDTKTIDWDSMQSKLGCCGLTDPSDWQSTWWYNQTGYVKTVPLSCCPVLNGTQTPKNLSACNFAAYSRNATDRENFIHTKGCGTAMKELYMFILREIFAVAILVLVVQVLVVLVTAIIQVCVGKAYVTVNTDGTGAERPLLDEEDSQRDASLTIEHQAEVHREASPTLSDTPHSGLTAVVVDSPPATSVIVHPLSVSREDDQPPTGVQSRANPATDVQNQYVVEDASHPVPPTQVGSGPASRGPSPTQAAGITVSPTQGGSQQVLGESHPLPADAPIQVSEEATSQPLTPSRGGSRPTSRTTSPTLELEITPAPAAAEFNLSQAGQGSQPTSPAKPELSSPGGSAKPASRTASPTQHTSPGSEKPLSQVSSPAKPEDMSSPTNPGQASPGSSVKPSSPLASAEGTAQPASPSHVSSEDSGNAGSPRVSPGGTVKPSSPLASPGGTPKPTFLPASPGGTVEPESNVSPRGSAKGSSPRVSPGGSTKVGSPRFSPGGSAKPGSRPSSPAPAESAGTEEFSEVSEEMN